MDGDGVGEYGTFGEMTGADGVRSNPDASRRDGLVIPPILSPALAGVGEDGIVTKSGYCFRIVLPGPEGRPVREGKAGPWRDARVGRPSPAPPPGATPAAGFTGSVDPDLAERLWCAYAWPVSVPNSGTRAFFVDQAGDVWFTANQDGRYAGRAHGPSWDAAMPEDGWGTAWVPPNAVTKAGERRGRDGNVWRVTH